MKRTSAFRNILGEGDAIIMPVVHDALCAKIAEEVGFKAIFTAGYANSASLLGKPDVGLLTMTEMVDAARRIAGAVDIPVIADADTGYGNVTNVVRAVREFERAGVAGMLIEDQVSPKRCGHMSGKEVIQPDEMVAKIRAAVDSRTDPDLVIIARTDSLSVNGIDDALERVNLYRAEGADMTFIEAVESVEHMRRVIEETEGPHMANMIPGGRTPILSSAELAEFGYRIIAYPTVNTYAVARATIDVFQHLFDKGTFEGLEDRLMDFEAFNEIVGLDGIRRLEKRYHSND
ncbi:MAG: isocitrate lyase/PEP mutase family protein [Methanomassiliicoccales archaeon]|nr:isocitrate lyase/PEP mutase family protein [Methanomassiliicoccales archaeon]